MSTLYIFISSPILLSFAQNYQSPLFSMLLCVCLVLRWLLWLWFRKSSFIKSVFSCGWFGKIYVWLKLWLKLRLNKK
jgi:hypothetical protein